MKASVLILVLLLVFSMGVANAQKDESTTYLVDHLPNDLTLDKSIIRSYRMTTDYYDFDLKSRFLAKRRLTGIVTYEMDNVEWKDVYYTESKVQGETFQQGDKQGVLQNFKYKQNGEVLNPQFFKDNLPGANPLIMNLIWDALAFDALAYCCWDSLELNKEFRAKNINSELELAIGTFENKDIKITWLGVTKINDETCAILKYSVMNNPLDVKFENIAMSGRSHYWGEMYVSLSDKEIEYASLTEDVLTDVSVKGQMNSILGYTVRTINLSRAK